MAVDSFTHQPEPSLDEVLDAIQQRQEAEIPTSEAPLTRAEVKANLTKQEKEDRQRAGRLVMKVLKSGASQDQVIPVDATFSRGRTSSVAIGIAQESLLARGILTAHETQASPANAGYEVQHAGDLSPDIDVLRVTGIDEDKANITDSKHAR